MANNVTKLSAIDKVLLEQVADLHGVPAGAYNIRKDGEGVGRVSTANIEITTKTDKPGIDIHVKPGTKNESVHIPVIITKTGHTELVYNDFYIGEGADVLIVAGCGIHNAGDGSSEHDGLHTFYIGKNAKMKYVEKHYGEGDGKGTRIMNPSTVVYLEEGAVAELDTSQIKGVDSTKRETKVVIGKNAECIITERLLTHGTQTSTSNMDIELAGQGSKTRVISRSVAKDDSSQVFNPIVVGSAECFGHIQCDAIIMGNAKVRAVPAISANSVDAQLIHEAAIGRIANDQLMKLMTLGLTAEQAEERILAGFLK